MTDSHAQDVLRAEAPTALAPQNAVRGLSSAQTEARVPEGLYLRPLARGMGAITGLVRDKDGTFYTLGQDSGQIFALADRGGDGRIDGRRTIADGFERPSGLVIWGERLIVTDATALWSVDIKSGERQIIAPVTQSHADISPRPIALYQDQIWLGLSEGAQSSLISVDPSTGRATLRRRFPRAPITTLAVQGAQIWAAVGNSFGPVTERPDGDLPFAGSAGAPILALSFLPAETLPKGWPADLSGSLLLTQGGAGSSGTETGGYNIVAVKSEFGQPSRTMTPLVDGLYNPRMNQIWAAPQDLLMTQAGLYITDRFGTLWQLAYDDRPAPAPRQTLGTALPDIPTPKPSRERGVTEPMQGSLLGKNSSTITQGSMIETGSILVDQWEAEKAAKDAAEQEANKKEAPPEKTLSGDAP